MIGINFEINVGRNVSDLNFDVAIGRTACEAYIATWTFWYQLSIYTQIAPVCILCEAVWPRSISERPKEDEVPLPEVETYSLGYPALRVVHVARPGSSCGGWRTHRRRTRGLRLHARIRQVGLGEAESERRIDVKNKRANKGFSRNRNRVKG
jgi:hypothetical protein